MTSLLHNGALSCVISVGFSCSGSWLLSKEEGAELLCSHCSRDQLGECGQQEGAGKCKFLESLENKKVVYWGLPLPFISDLHFQNCLWQ